MADTDISDYITLKKTKSGDTLSIEQKYVKVRSNTNKVLAIHYKAPMYLTAELEMYFDNFSTIDKLNLNIGDTGWIGVNYRGLIDGKANDLPEDYDYKILMLEEHKCPKPEYRAVKRSSTFKPRFTVE